MVTAAMRKTMRLTIRGDRLRWPKELGAAVKKEGQRLWQ